MRISDWSSDVCSSDLARARRRRDTGGELEARPFSITQLNLPINPNPWKAIALDGFIDRAIPLWPASLKTSKCRYFRTACWHTRRKLNPRSDEHTSELQSLMRISYADFCLKKTKNYN